MDVCTLLPLPGNPLAETKDYRYAVFHIMPFLHHLDNQLFFAPSSSTRTTSSTSRLRTLRTTSSFPAPAPGCGPRAHHASGLSSLGYTQIYASRGALSKSLQDDINSRLTKPQGISKRPSTSTTIPLDASSVAVHQDDGAVATNRKYVYLPWRAPPNPIPWGWINYSELAKSGILDHQRDSKGLARRLRQSLQGSPPRRRGQSSMPKKTAPSLSQVRQFVPMVDQSSSKFCDSSGGSASSRSVSASTPQSRTSTLSSDSSRQRESVSRRPASLRPSPQSSRSRNNEITSQPPSSQWEESGHSEGSRSVYSADRSAMIGTHDEYYSSSVSHTVIKSSKGTIDRKNNISSSDHHYSAPEIADSGPSGSEITSGSSSRSPAGGSGAYSSTSIYVSAEGRELQEIVGMLRNLLAQKRRTVEILAEKAKLTRSNRRRPPRQQEAVSADER